MSRILQHLVEFIPVQTACSGDSLVRINSCECPARMPLYHIRVERLLGSGRTFSVQLNLWTLCNKLPPLIPSAFPGQPFEPPLPLLIVKLLTFFLTPSHIFPIAVIPHGLPVKIGCRIPVIFYITVHDNLCPCIIIPVNRIVQRGMDRNRKDKCLAVI